MIKVRSSCDAHAQAVAKSDLVPKMSFCRCRTGVPDGPVFVIFYLRWQSRLITAMFVPTISTCLDDLKNGGRGPRAVVFYLAMKSLGNIPNCLTKHLAK